MQICKGTTITCVAVEFQSVSICTSPLDSSIVNPIPFHQVVAFSEFVTEC